VLHGDLGWHLRLVIRPDSFRRRLESFSHAGIDPIDGGLDLPPVDDEGVERHPIEPLRVGTNRCVTVGTYRGEYLAHGVDRTARRGRRAGQNLLECRTGRAEVDTAEHSYTLPAGLSLTRGFPAHCGMDSDAAEISSLTTVIADAAQRIGNLAERRTTDPDDPVVGRLHEIERQLTTVQRRLRDVGRALG